MRLDTSVCNIEDYSGATGLCFRYLRPHRLVATGQQTPPSHTISGKFAEDYQVRNVPRLEDLPFILEKSNRLARIDRYLAGLEEFHSFFLSVQQLLAPEPDALAIDDDLTFRSARTKRSAQFEASRAREKIQQEQRLCQTYMRQYDALVQLVSRVLCPRTTTKTCTLGYFLQRDSNYRAVRQRSRDCRAIR